MAGHEAAPAIARRKEGLKLAAYFHRCSLMKNSTES
jgi:hypothetical protein